MVGFVDRDGCLRWDAVWFAAEVQRRAGGHEEAPQHRPEWRGCERGTGTRRDHFSDRVGLLRERLDEKGVKRRPGRG